MKTWITPILCCLLLIAAGCGKKGDPVPKTRKTFSRGKALMPPSPETAASPSPRS